MGEHWETLTFGDLVPGDVVKLDEEGPEETVRESRDATTSSAWYLTDLSCGYRAREAPVLVRFPRPEVGA